MAAASCVAARDKDRAQYKQSLDEVEKMGTTSEAERARQLQGYAAKVKACEDAAATEKRACADDELRHDKESAQQKAALIALSTERDQETAVVAQTKLEVAALEKRLEQLTAEKIALTEERDALKTAAAKAWLRSAARGRPRLRRPRRRSREPPSPADTAVAAALPAGRAPARCAAARRAPAGRAAASAAADATPATQALDQLHFPAIVASNLVQYDSSGTPATTATIRIVRRSMIRVRRVRVGVEQRRELLVLVDRGRVVDLVLLVPVGEILRRRRDPLRRAVGELEEELAPSGRYFACRGGSSVFAS